LEKEGQWGDHEIDERYHTEGYSQPAPDSELEVCEKREEGWGGHGPKKGPKRHRRRLLLTVHYAANDNIYMNLEM
jgi:hypothetical protein